MRHLVAIRGTVISCLVCALVLAAGPVRSEGTISFLAGLATVNDEVSDLITGDGVSFGVSGHTMVRPTVSFGGGLNVMVFEGIEEQGVDVTESAAAATLQASLRIYPIPTRPGARIYFGGLAGFGALAWQYGPELEFFMGTDTDGIGFLFFGPEAGVELFLSPRFFLEGSARYLITSYADETTEEFEWDLDGGNMALVQVGIGFGF